MEAELNMKELITHTVWCNGDKRILFHSHDQNLGFSGQVHYYDGNIYNWEN